MWLLRNFSPRDSTSVLFSGRTGSGVVSRFVFMPVTPTSAVNAHFLPVHHHWRNHPRLYHLYSSATRSSRRVLLKNPKMHQKKIHARNDPLEKTLRTMNKRTDDESPVPFYGPGRDLANKSFSFPYRGPLTERLQIEKKRNKERKRKPFPRRCSNGAVDIRHGRPWRGQRG